MTDLGITNVEVVPNYESQLICLYWMNTKLT